jgi:hypothetical protein
MTWLKDSNTKLNKPTVSNPVKAVVSALTIGGKYNFKHQPERLNYIGKNWSGNGYWHQFEKVGEQGVWCELLDRDLHMIEETKAH